MFNKRNLLISLIIFIFVFSFADRAIISREIPYDKININTADKYELLTLGDVDLAKADAIIKYREAYGGFKKIEELKNVPGISEEIFKINKDFITVESKKVTLNE